MTSPFAAPAAAGGGVDFDDLNGRLLLISPYAVEAGIKTSFGEKEAIRADVAVLDGPDAGETHTDTLIFPKVLIGQLRPKINQKVIGRLGQGQAKPGQKPPWILTEATEADTKIGVAFLAGSLTSADDSPPF